MQAGCNHVLLQIFGFHTPCCYPGMFAFPEPASQECKVGFLFYRPPLHQAHSPKFDPEEVCNGRLTPLIAANHVRQAAAVLV